MATEMSIKEIVEMFLATMLLLAGVGGASVYLSPDLPKLKLLNYEIKNTLNLVHGEKIKINYKTNDEKIKISNENSIIKVSINEVNVENPTYSNHKITQDGKTITITP